MNPALLSAAVIVLAGAVVGVSARDARIALGGLAVTLFVAPFLADPLPSAVALGTRLVAAALAAYLPWIAVRDPGSITRGSLLGAPVEALVGLAAFVIGFGTAGLGAPAVGPAEAQGAGVALIALAVGPLAFGRDVFRLGSGAVLLLGGVLLVRTSLAGTPSGLESVVTGALFIALGGSIAFLVVSASMAGAHGGEVFAAAGPVTTRVAPQAARRTVGRAPGRTAPRMPTFAIGRSRRPAARREDSVEQLVLPVETDPPLASERPIEPDLPASDEHDEPDGS
ncbi:MAG TPA: hypothetical protein VEG29_04835 [Candidatus Binatia bacterium]|nr:hypothetical protein [Candidatus Binatia bacterium]